MSRKRLSRRDFLKSSALSVIGIGLAACTAPQVGPQSTGSGGEPVDQAATELRWHHRLGGWEIYDQRISAFQEANPSVKIVEEEFPEGSAEYGPKIVSLVAAGLIGDLTWVAIGSGSFQFLAQNNALATLDDLVAADASGFTLDEYYPRTLDALRMDGSLLALPELAHGDAVCLFFNRDMIEGEGKEAPTMDWTRDDL
ncbi:MAG: hypothetical protein DCC57_25035, partial [Chloroflexi bacterium]